MHRSALLPWLALLVATLLWGAGAVSAAAQPRPLALVVGISGYAELPSLPNAANDARAMAARLNVLGYEVIGPVIDPDWSTFHARIEDFRARLKGASWGLFFFSGHAVELDIPLRVGQVDTLLLPVDAPRTAEPLRIKAKGIAAQDIIASLRQSVPALVAILDACRDSPLHGITRGGAPSKGLSTIAIPPGGPIPAAPDAPHGTYLVYAAQPREVAYDRLPGDDSDPNGLLTRTLLHLLAEDPTRPIGRLMENVRDEVARVAGHAGLVQIPHLDPNMIGSGRVTIAGAPVLPRRTAPPSAAAPVVGMFPSPSPPAALPPPAPSRAPGTVFRDCVECHELVVVPAGRFEMGSPANELGRVDDEGPQRWVSIGSFAVGRFEVTFSEWDACVAGGGCGGHRPADFGWGRGLQPVINVSWRDAQAYVSWLSRRTGGLYRLLTEAEWEYVARGGTPEGVTHPFWTGPAISTDQANYDGSGPFGGPVTGVDRGQPTRIGSFQANGFGLHDVHGNVWEWVEDCYGPYLAAPSDGQAASGPPNCRRVRRGGSFSSPTNRVLRSAYRDWGAQGGRHLDVGFRVARTLSPLGR